jgi:hypothetical protein
MLEYHHFVPKWERAIMLSSYIQANPLSVCAL